MQDGDLGPRSDCDVGELEGDVTTADERDAARERVELEKLLARDQVLGAGEAQGRGPSSGGNDEVVRLDFLAAHAELPWREEPGASVQRRDAGLRKLFLASLWNRACKRPLEPHQRRPVDPRRLRVKAFVFHPLQAIQRLGGAHQHLLGIATAQRARTAERPPVDDSCAAACRMSRPGC